MIDDANEPERPNAARDTGFVFFVNRVARVVAEHSVAKGLCKGDGSDDYEQFAWAHAELSEAFEARHRDVGASNKIPAFSAVEEELADVVMMLLGFASLRGWRVAEALIAKLEHNHTRTYRHGRTK